MDRILECNFHANDALILESLKDINIDEIGLSIKASTCLTRSGITNLHQLCEKSMSYLSHIRALGDNTLDEIFFKVYDYKITMRRGEMSLDKYNALCERAEKSAEKKNKLMEEIREKLMKGGE